MEPLIHRLLLISVSAVLALHFPELVAWKRLRDTNRDPENTSLARTLSFLRTLLRIVFFFYIILLAYTLHHQAPSRFLVYPLPLIHLFGLIVGERDLLKELPGRGMTDQFVRILMFGNSIEIVLLGVIALQVYGIISS